MRTRIIGLVSMLLLVFSSCGKDDNYSFFTPSDGTDVRYMEQRLPSQNLRRVLIYVSAGFNSLSNYLDANLATLEDNFLPTGKYYSADAILVLARKPAAPGNYSTPTSPVLFRLYKDTEGNVVRDTLTVWEPEEPLCTPKVFGEAMDYIKDYFPAKGYGMIFSSHALGWLPPNYKVTDPEINWAPGIRSIGQDRSSTVSYELALDEFASAIPFRMDYLIFDACLMGCVEVAWQFRGKADIVGFSPTEILAQGFDYGTLTTHLFAADPDPIAVCEDYFMQYGEYGDATVSAVDTRKMEPLANLCKTLFDKYRTQLKNMNPNPVQRYFRPSVTPNCTVLYDLKDVLLKAGITNEEATELEQALQEAVVYKATSKSFLSIPINTYSGLSLYLPSAGNATLDSYYKGHIAWNDATQLIQ